MFELGLRLGLSVAAAASPSAPPYVEPEEEPQDTPRRSAADRRETEEPELAVDPAFTAADRIELSNGKQTVVRTPADPGTWGNARSSQPSSRALLGAGSRDFDIEMTGMDADGWTVNVTYAPAGAYLWPYLAIGDEMLIGVYATIWGVNAVESRYRAADGEVRSGTITKSMTASTACLRVISTVRSLLTLNPSMFVGGGDLRDLEDFLHDLWVHGGGFSEDEIEIVNVDDQIQGAFIYITGGVRDIARSVAEAYSLALSERIPLPSSRGHHRQAAGC